jgi:hypothetical protein
MLLKPAGFVLLFMTFCAASFGQTRSVVAARGKVKSVYVVEYEAKGKPEKPVKSKRIFDDRIYYNYALYDTSGKITEERAIGKDSVIAGKKIYKYDKDSLEAVETYSGQDKLAEKVHYRRDKKQRAYEVKYTDGKKSVLKALTYDYNDNDNSVTVRILDEHNNLNKYLPVPQQIFFYDANGLPAYVDHYTYKNPTEMYKALKSEWKYDKDGRLMSYIDYFKNDSVRRRVDYHYGPSGIADTLVESEFFFSREPKQTITSVYDDKGNLLSATVFSNETNRSEIKRYRYDFDALGNWIRRTTYINDTPSEIAERTVEYYPVTAK